MTPAPSTITFIGNALRRVVERQTQATCPRRRSLCLLGLRDSVTPLRPDVAPSADPPPQGWSLSRRLTTLLQYRYLSVYGRFRLRWCVTHALLQQDQFYGRCLARQSEKARSQLVRGILTTKRLPASALFTS